MGEHVRYKPKVMSTSEAFGATLRVLYPQRPALADEIRSRAWFVWHAPDEARVANEAVKTLRTNVTEKRIRLRGVLKQSGPPADIDPIDAAEGDLDIFKGMLEIRVNGRIRREYTSVYCIAEDVENVVRDLPRPAPPLKGDLEQADRNHVKANKGPRQWTTIKQDWNWARGKKITRERMRELRCAVRRK